MTQPDLLTWFDEIAVSAQAVLQQPKDPAVVSWLLSQMQSAIQAVFPPTHAVRRRWDDAHARVLRSPGSDVACPDAWILAEFVGIFLSAHAQLKAGRVSGLVDGIRVETVTECLEVAETLLSAGHPTASAVLAGGALEVHLRHLCGRFGVTWSGEGSIQKYNDALAKARNNGMETISASDTKSITAWGGRRNDAAHDPVKFAGTVEEVRLIVEGIRQFLARTVS